MSDNTVEPTELSIGDAEPSMEDILASIRKVIADDHMGSVGRVGSYNEPIPEAVAETSYEQDTDSADSADNLLQDTLVLETEENTIDLESNSAEFETIVSDIQDDTLDLVELEIPLAEPESDILDLAEIVEAEAAQNVQGEQDVLDTSSLDADLSRELGFDESLDLVIESDEADYLSDDLTADLTSNSIETEDWRSLKKTPAALVGSIDQEMHSVEDRLETAQSVAQSSEKLEAENLLKPVDTPVVIEAIETPVIETPVDVETHLDDTEIHAEEVTEEEQSLDSLETDFENEDMSIVGDPDQDMDLVKSLLADLMDEPAVDENTAALEGEPYDDEESGAGDILNEMLEQTISDEEAINDTAAVQETESDLARIARQAREAVIETPHIDDAVDAEQLDDVVSVDNVDIKSKFALVASAAAAASVVTSMQDDTNGDAEQEALDDTMPEALDDMLEDNLQETEIETKVQEVKTAQAETLAPHDENVEGNIEEDIMAKTAKKESEIMSNAERDASSSFASLTHAVKEKTELEENGPPIGDMVKDALKPMLQEWLDKNLKAIVQRAVTAEIKRISSNK